MELEQKIDFSSPRRQASIAIGVILIKFLRQTIKAFWPLLISLFIGTRSSNWFEDIIGYIAIGFGALNLIGSVLTYFRFYFHLEDNAIVIDKGLLRRTHTNIPFERIQTINFKQGIIHQIFNVVSVEIDTAGAKKSEMSIDALTKQEAESLRSQIMANKQQQAIEDDASYEEVKAAIEKEEAEELILHLNPVDLMKVGVSQNHLRSMGIIFAFVFTTLDQVTDDWGDLVTDQADNLAYYLPDNSFLVFGITVILVLLISFLFSLVNTVLKYFELSFFIKKSGFKLVRGLLNREEISINKSKIQTISWSETPVRHFLGLWTLQIEQASSAEAEQLKSKIKVPGCYIDQVDRVVTTAFPAEYYRDEPRHQVSKLLKYRLLFFLGLLPTLGLGTILWFNIGWEALYALLWLPLIFLIVHLYHSKRSFELNEELLRNNSGIFGRKHQLTQIYKVQAIKIKQSWYQRRKKLATVQLFTAAGQSSIPFVPLETALELENYLLYRAESDSREWM